jgi:SAM-dependent methyltransferase
MGSFNRKSRWEHIYTTKQLHEVSWFQPIPETSLNFITKLCPNKLAKIIDVGGGDSYLVDHLLELGYQDLSVLDISEAAITRAKHRLGEKADRVTWIVADIATFKPTAQYDLWHDRAAFHFLTNETDIQYYQEITRNQIAPNGHIVLGTFSDQGPKKCSGIDITQYTETTMSALFTEGFEKINCLQVDHPTPFNTLQHFIFCAFKRKDL